MEEIPDFQWKGEGVSASRRKPNEKHYKGFKNGKIHVAVDDFVLIRNDDSMDPEDPMDCYVAKVLDLYDAEGGAEPYIAKVNWYSRVYEIPPAQIKQLNGIDYRYELVEDHRTQWKNIVDAESIFGKCLVYILDEDSKFMPERTNGFRGIPIFFCRYKFTGNKFSSITQKSINKTPTSRRSNGVGVPSMSKSAVKASPKTEEKVSTSSLKTPKICIRRVDYLLSVDSKSNSVSVSTDKRRQSQRKREVKFVTERDDSTRSESKVSRQTTSTSEAQSKSNTRKNLKSAEINEFISPTPTKKTRLTRRNLDFSNSNTEIDRDHKMATTRYGRRVRSLSYKDSYLDSPKKVTEKVKKKKTYIVDNSDSGSESAYSHQEDSSSDSDCFSEIRDTPSNRKKSTTKKNVSTTPKSNKKLPSVSTPTIPERKQPVNTPKNLLEESRQRLHVSAVPSSLPCREDEFSDIYSFVESNLLSDTGGCMYISGVPGTGKTATVKEVIRTLQIESESGNLPEFTFVEVNGMKMTDPYQCYVQIFMKLTGEKIAAQQAADLLEKRFSRSGPKKEAVVLLVDELDKLWTKKQTVMYNIFDWPSKTNSRLIVIAIANTMDLPERLMKNRISSRLGLTRRTFQPYTFRELQEIVMSRIKELQVFDSDAVQLVARKVAAVSGDARRALEICKRAAEIAEEGIVQVSPSKKKRMLVGMAHVDAALNQMFTSPFVAAIKGCSQVQKLFFRSILAEFERTGSEETVLLKVYRQLLALCRFEGLHPPNSSQASTLCVHLASSRLILIDDIQNDIYMKIRLNVSIDDVNYALSGLN